MWLIVYSFGVLILKCQLFDMAINIINSLPYQNRYDKKSSRIDIEKWRKSRGVKVIL